MAERIRVLIADDSADARASLTEALASEPDIAVVGAAAYGPDALELAEQLRPDVLLFETAMPGLDGVAATERLAKRVPTVAVILMSSQGEALDWRRAMLAGARDFLVKPIAREDVSSSIRQVHAVQQRELERLTQAAVLAPPSTNGHEPSGEDEPQGGKIVAIFAPKGGVGRTTLAVNLAVAAVRAGARVSLVDASFQFGDVGMMLDLNAKSGSIGDLLSEARRDDPDSVDTVMAHHSTGLRVLLAPPSPEVAELIRPDHLRAMLERLRGGSDLVVVDTPNWFNDTTLAVLDAADVILGVMTLEITNLKNMRLFLQLAASLSYLDKLQLVLNRSDAALGIRLPDAEQSLGRVIDHTIVSDGRTVVYALNRGVPFSASNPEAQVSRDVKRLAEHLLRAATPGPTEPKDARKRRKALLAWR